jgi:Ca2+-binding RTX toxin-like protein
VTSPENLFRLNPKKDTNELLSSMAELATLENGVLGFLDVPASFPRDYEAHDGLAAGDLIEDARAEVVIGDISNGHVYLANIPANMLAASGAYRINWYQRTPFKVGHNDEGFASGDRLSVGRVFGGTKDHVVVADASADVFIPYDGAGKRQGSFIISESGVIRDIESFDGLAAGDVVPGGRDDIVFADRSKDEITVMQLSAPYPNDPFSTWRQASVVTQFSTSYEAHDGLAVGDVTGDATAEIVLADRSSDKVFIFSYTGTLLGSFSRTFDEGDGLSVASVVYTHPDKAEIVISDASADRVDAHAANGTVLSSVKRDIEGFDGLTAGEISGDVAEVVVADRSLNYLDFHDLYRQSADKYALRELLKAEFSFGFFSGPVGAKATGAWSSLLHPDFVSNGYLLIVGESDVVPTWGDKRFGTVLTTRGKEALVADVTDYPYASTYGEEIVPELAIGRIIGNTATELRKPIEASIGVTLGAAGHGFDRSHAFVVSGYPAGLGGGSDKIDFASEALTVAGIMKKAGIDPIYMDTSINTVLKPDGTIDEAATRAKISGKFFATTPSKDVVFLSGHGSGTGWDVFSYWDFLNQTDPFAGTNPFVFASSCNTGQYFSAFSFANAVVSEGAGAYVGATKWGLGTHVAISKLLFSKWDAAESVGEVVREVKQSIGFDTYPPLFGNGTTTTLPDNKERYWSAIYHVFGDPKFGSEGPPVTSTASGAAATMPPSSVSVDVPGYEVDEGITGTEVTIPGGDLLAIDGFPVVPSYSVTVEIPSGYEVQDVVMTHRSEPSIESGIEMIPLIEAVGGAGAGASAAAAHVTSIGHWPEASFGWDVVAGLRGDVLAITVYPVRYQAGAGEIEFFDHYEFDVETAPSSTQIEWFDVSDRVFGLDPVTGVVRFGDGEHGSVPPDGRDVVVATTVHEATGTLVEGLPLRLLHAVRGAGEVAVTWDPGGQAPGDYEVRVELRTADGTLLDRAVANVTIEADLPTPHACGGLVPTIVGTPGDDVLRGTPGDDVIAGLGGDDVIYGMGGHDVICGGDGDDRIDGGPGDDVLHGGDGDDDIDPDLGHDAISGGAGEDLARLDGDPSGVTADLQLGVAASSGGIDATLVGIENLTGGPGPDVLIGNDGVNVISGASGDDELMGAGGADRLLGAAGDDVLDGGTDDDNLVGGNGDDVAHGGSGDDRLQGNRGDDLLYGDAGNDRLDGGPGSDEIIGGPGDDIIDGGGGSDTCDGEVVKRC